MADAGEPSLSGEHVESPIELALHIGGDVEILHSAAAGTHEVMVVTGQFLGELIPTESVLRGDPADEPSRLELRQVP